MVATLEIELDEPEAPAVGAGLRGRVRVAAEPLAGCTVDVAAVITLTDLSWRAFKGTHREAATTLPVSTSEHAFSLPPLRGPPTYAGSAITLTWSIVATLRRNDEVLATATLPIGVGEPVALEPAEPLDYRGYAQRPSGYEPSFGPRHVEGLERTGPTDPANVVLRRLRDWIAARRRRRVSMEVTVSPTRVRRGDVVEVTVTLNVFEPTTIEGVSAWTVEYEGLRLHILSYASELEDQPARHKLCDRALLDPGSHHYTTRIAIPADAARSYTTDTLCIAWFIRVAVQFDGEPELRRDWHMSVY